ncbi:acyltransferase domain-containing protein [Hyphomicrobium facile]|uniref:[acyl-carrier-protein] S-malonyltransferase n=1 Tax=Hyphomicrobium facile TaxID=51670 RepID=A0A1I7NR07_9HYPH|nr:acyltransferase domain-containing protein [Hyphomicrobium facile]SFV37055.1 [acyl-carrier-protein] S-malonyltransferase [Hyphomicrobium facile]
MTLTILCSGQGRQHSGMFALTGDVPEAQALFARAAALLGGRDPRDIVLTENSEALHHNRIGQILCSLQSLAATVALRDVIPDRIIVAGYSVGEVAAWGVAGVLSMIDTLDLVARRAEAMDAASPAGDGLLFVRGLSREVVDALCEKHDAAVAIVNPDDAFIIGGCRKALQIIAQKAKEMNAVRVVDVPVEVASHTKRLANASSTFREILDHVPVTLPAPNRVRLLSGIDASPVADIKIGSDKLAAQISQTVHWADCLQACIEGGATAFIELGPGPALSGMVTAAYPGVTARCLDDFRTLDGARAWLKRYS